MNNTTKVLIAFAAGAAAGTALGLLFAPDKGSDIRKKMKEEGKKFAGALNEKLEKIKQKSRWEEEAVAE